MEYDLPIANYLNTETKKIREKKSKLEHSFPIVNHSPVPKSKAIKDKDVTKHIGDASNKANVKITSGGIV